MTTEKSPSKLGQLATEKLTKVLQSSVSNMNRIIASDIRKQLRDVKPVESASSSSSSTTSAISSKLSISQMTCAKAALQMMTVRKYLMGGMTNPSATKMTLTQQVVQDIISTAIDTKNFGLIRLVICDWITILDFRALDKYSPFSQEIVNWRQTPSQSAACIASSSSSKILTGVASSSSSKNNNSPIPNPATPLSIFCLPPDEWDWFSRDRLGSIISMNDACELFSILGMSQAGPKIQELYLNARRREYWACPPDIMEITADILLQLGQLTILVLRGMCDDYMLKLVGLSVPSLKQLDISGSHFVTDAGLKNLFFKDVKENPATYLMKSFIDKNLKNMNPLVNSLEMLDYSFTNVSGLGRKMIYHLPSSFIFKRVFARNENYSYGHHIFLRRKCTTQVRIPTENCSKTELTKFEAALEPFIGSKGIKAFSKYTEHHPWKNCTLYMYQDDGQVDVGGLPKFYGIITPSNEEKRVYGTVCFQDSSLIELYSMFPININTLGEACPKLQVFRGIVTDVWKMSSSALTDLTILDMFADPVTTKSILESVPNLRKVRIRIIRDRLTDEYIIKPLTTFMCCRTLEELWISSGTYRSNSEQSVNNGNNANNVDDEAAVEEKDIVWQSFNEVRANYYCAERPPRYKRSSAANNVQKQNNNVPLDQSRGSSSDELECDDECQINDLVHLTSDCIRTILKACQKLRRIGDIAWWTPVDRLDLDTICKQLRKSKREVTFVWENQIFPSSSKL